MKSVSFAVHNAWFRLCDRAGACKVGPLAHGIEGLPADRYGVSEFALPSGEIVARRVTHDGRTECWLRADFADAAEAALRDEAALYDRIAAEAVGWSREADQRRADAEGLSLEAFRTKRNHALARIDARRGVNSRGMR